MRYHRQTLLKEIGTKGQSLLKEKSVAIVGVGALGTVAAELLARAGVGNITLIDRDVVEETNLQRQTLFTENDVRKSKAKVAEQKLKEINSEIFIESYATHLNSVTITNAKADLILDCTDNLETRFLINDYCRKNKIPWIYGAAIKTEGYIMPILPEGPCLQCFLQPASLETCDTVGVLNTATTIIAAKQTTLAMKILLGENITPQLSYLDIWHGKERAIQVSKKEGCETCNGNFRYLEKKDRLRTVSFCGTGRYQIQADMEKIKTKLQEFKTTEDQETIQFKNLIAFKDGRVLIKANSEQEARATVSKWIGN
jgi:molybdopterin-synthase adenylyltransferase